jgi:hypothetical protein
MKYHFLTYSWPNVFNTQIAFRGRNEVRRRTESKYQARTNGLFQRTNVESRSF